MRIIKYSLLFSFILLLVVNCFVSNPDPDQPFVEIISPKDSVIIMDSTIVKVNAQDDDQVNRVALFIDSNTDSTLYRYSGPYQFPINFNKKFKVIGSKHIFYAKAWDDDENEMISTFVTLFYKWMMVEKDNDEQFDNDINKILLRHQSDIMEFRLELNDKWTNPGLNTGLNAAIFIDADRNSETGLNPATQVDTVATDTTIIPEGNISYVVNDIGPDYAIILGLNRNLLYEWDQNKKNWTQLSSSIDYNNLSPDTNIVEIGVPLNKMDNIANKIYIVALNLSFESGKAYWDWAPDTSHIEYSIKENRIQ
jgi:hypothetical protein